MQCPRCQHENEAGAKFCEECAAPLARACAKCGRTLSPTAKFCPECAYPTGLSATPPPATRLDSPESYTPKHLAEKILTSKTALEGERKQVTVLFADLKGSMELMADRDPEEARKLLDPVLERMMEAVHHYEGTVNQVMGDGIMALFGAPLACEDHAVRACYAALRMQETVQRYADSVRRAEGIPLQIRVGLNSGEVVVRSIGSDLRMDYTAVGQTTHVAARMEQMALPGSILLSAETLGLAEGYVEVRVLGPLPVKGLAAPLEVYELTRAATVRSRFQAAAARGLTRFVGRESELEQLRQALERARAGHGQVMAVVGEPGVGKSRLYWEFTHSHRTQGWLIVESGSVSYGKATALLPLIDLLRAYFQIEARDEGRKIREKVTGKLLSLDRALEPSLPALLWLLDVAPDDPQWQQLDPPQRRQRTLDGVKRLLLRESQVQPLLILFEDLHWIDAETQALLDSLVESLPTARLLLLVNYRPEYQHGWASKTYYRQLRIDPLPPESAGELLEALLGRDPGLAPLKRLLIERTEGNPFFLEETVRTLVETKALVGERGAYRLEHRLTSIQVPATVQAVLAARIDRLPSEEKRLLQTAAVIGHEVPFALLQAVADLSEDRLRRSLTQLQAAEFLYETSLFPELAYTFKHALTHEVVYASLLQERRRALHARIVEAIEASAAPRLAEELDRLAYHAFRGEAWEKAVAYLRQAGAKAAARSANREAVAFFEQALVALRHLPERRETIEQAIDLRCDLRNAHLPLGDHERMVEHIRAAEPLARALNDPLRSARVLAYMSTSFFMAGDHHGAIDTGERALAIATNLGDFVLEAELKLRLAMACYALGDYRRALDLTQRNIEVLTGDRIHQAFIGPNLTSVLSRVWFVRGLAESGRFVEAVPLAEGAVRIAEEIDHASSLSFALWGLGALYLQKGALADAVPVLERAVRLCQVADLRLVFALTLACLGLAYALSGRWPQALPLLEQAGEYSAKSFGEHARRMGLISEAYLLAGQIDHAMKLAEGALKFARDGAERGHEAWILRLFGEVAARCDPPKVEQGDGHYRQAMVLAQELGMRPLVAHCQLGLGKLYRRAGDGAKAHEHLTTATTMYREMGMGFWLEKAEGALRGDERR